MLPRLSNTAAHGSRRPEGHWLRVGLLTSLCATQIVGCRSRTSEPSMDSGAPGNLRPIATRLAGETVRGTVYVPVYSSIPLGLDIKLTGVELTSTVSVRNTSAQQPVVLEAVTYYDSTGKHVRDYIAEPSELPPLATTQFLVREADTAGGPGAKFLIRWAGAAGIDEPLMEAVMVGRSGNAGISFVSVGRPVKTDAR
jgi:hypothetical protein